MARVVLTNDSFRVFAVSEAEACRWLGRRVRITSSIDGSGSTGCLRHVSSRSAFILDEGDGVQPLGGTIRSIPLAGIVRIEPAAETESMS